jgi:hypothetical protein
MRYYVAGEEVDGEAFWRAIRRLGGTATVVAHPPKRVGYRLTPAGAAALDAAEQEQEARHQAAKDQAREPGRWPTGTGRAGR